MARVAPAAQSILDQATRLRPRRSKASDGTIGDRAHRLRRSDHNPDRQGVVLAADLTHDPRNGMDAHAWARWLAGRNDRRVKYIISNGQVWYPGRGWKKYRGSNKHVKHVHVSINKAYQNDTSPWFNGFLVGTPVPAPAPSPRPAPPAPPAPTTAATDFLKAIQMAIFLAKADIMKNGPVKQGSSRAGTVRVIQTGLQHRVGATIISDGKFGPQTEQWVKWFQGLHGLPVTGVVDARTINSIFP